MIPDATLLDQLDKAIRMELVKQFQPMVDYAVEEFRGKLNGLVAEEVGKVAMKMTAIAIPDEFKTRIDVKVIVEKKA
jgi:hypothetical protein